MSTDPKKLERLFEAFEGKHSLLFDFLVYVETETDGKLLSPWEPAQVHEYYSFVRRNRANDIVAGVVWADGDYSWMLDVRGFEGPKGPGNKGSFGLHEADSDADVKEQVAELRVKAQAAADDRLRESGWMLA